MRETEQNMNEAPQLDRTTKRSRLSLIASIIATLLSILPLGFLWLTSVGAPPADVMVPMYAWGAVFGLVALALGVWTWRRAKHEVGKIAAAMALLPLSANVMLLIHGLNTEPF